MSSLKRKRKQNQLLTKQGNMKAKKLKLPPFDSPVIKQNVENYHKTKGRSFWNVVTGGRMP